jgi:NADH:quinone reductase (non-electrogenic)
MHRIGYSELAAAVSNAGGLAIITGLTQSTPEDLARETGAWSCGMVVGLIHDIPTFQELIDRIMAEAEAIIRGRLEGLLAA